MSPTTKSFSTTTTTTTTPTKVNRPRRSLLYIPGSSQKMLGKAPTCGADTVCLDLEDGVAFSAKQTARDNITQFFQESYQLFPPKQEVCIRVNPPSAGEGLYEKDIAMLLALPHPPHSIALPKIEYVSELVDIFNVIDQLEKKHAAVLNSAPIELIGMIETPQGIINLPELLNHSKKTNNHKYWTSIIFGGDDYANAAGSIRTESNHELAFPRGMVLLHAAAHGLGVIDIVCKEFKDLDRFAAESQESVEKGFIGRQNIHPSQIAVSNKVYSPSQDLTHWAVAVTKLYEVNEAKGVGAWTYKGAMIDMPTIKKAFNIKSRAEACGVDVAAIAAEIDVEKM